MTNLADLLTVLDDKVKEEFASMPDVEDRDDLDVEQLPKETRKWLRLQDVVAVVCDLKGSTGLSTGKNARSTASIYEAATGNAVKVFHEFEADFIAIQGDGAFALFWGDRRYERAVCAGITIKTFSHDSLVERLKDRWPTSDTGFKVAIANGRVLAKTIGTPRTPAEQEAIWAGNPVNFAAKAAQQADVHQLVVTAGVWDAIGKNHYLTYSCDCGGTPARLWSEFQIDKIPEDHLDREGMALDATWCKTCGPDFCKAVLDGKLQRDTVDEAIRAGQVERYKLALAQKQEQARQQRAARQRGL